MRGSLGLSAYRTLARRRGGAEFVPPRPRPTGELIWIHAAEEGNNRALNDLAHRLVSMRHGCHVLLTAAHDGFNTRGSDAVIAQDLPGEHPDVTDAFIAHWKPDVVIWAWGGLRPNLILSAADSGAYMMLIDAARDGFDSRRDRWLPEVPRSLVSKFHTISARSKPAHLRLAQLGGALEKINLTDPLRPFGRMLPASDNDLKDVTQALGGRPVWLAMHVAADEAQTILKAHRQALMASHRLLLILHPAQTGDALDMIDIANASGLRTTCWSGGTLPDDNTQVLIADTAEDLGLWLRVAPVSFLGGSVRPGHTSCDPYLAAAHGTALIYGPHVGANVDAYSGLMNAGAARIVNDADTLGRAVMQMIAPDQAAQMAMAGWDVVTQGADSLDSIITQVQDRLNAVQDGNA
ncbi:glycosyltransferase N-terminal domain-containing protein [uncultured Tateyamaria sp.]|uniref:3-deoxy-D-manno-octulosonic acid transferase n=1 Tax=uncultured Tateyamaria sp. TaxID=455651 RepID=UPI002616D2BF|nr:glycosyltransferase N-terminal domain-containing protein [uncultured Tateyamaria sp.]